MTLHESSLRIILRDNFKGGFFMSEKMLVTQALDESKRQTTRLG